VPLNDHPDVYEEIVYEELTPEAEIEIKKQLMA